MHKWDLRSQMTTRVGDVMLMAIVPGLLCSSPEESASKPAVRFPWAHYQEVVAALRNRSAHGLELLGRASLIPDVILQAHLCALMPAASQDFSNLESLTAGICKPDASGLPEFLPASALLSGEQFSCCRRLRAEGRTRLYLPEPSFASALHTLEFEIRLLYMKVH